MKNLNVALLSIFFSEIIQICHGECFCCIEEKGVQPKELPKWLLRWSSKEYGLEFSGGTTINREKLQKNDLNYEAGINKVAPEKLMQTIDEYINNQINQLLPEFSIVRLDPIAFEFNGKKMLLILEHLEFQNLLTYDKEKSIFDLTAFAETGDHEITEDMYKKMYSDWWNFGKNVKKNDGKCFLENRRDIDWLVRLVAKFKTDQGEEGLKPITTDLDFQIQPENREDHASTNESTDKPIPLRARGKIRLEVHNLIVVMKLIIKHTQDALRKYFAKNIAAINRVPEFNIDYSMSEMKIVSLELNSYDHDIVWPEEIIDENEDVNGNHPGFTKPPEETILSVPIPQKDYVEEHLNSIIKNIMTNQLNIRQRLCVNMISKMTWKIMKFSSKLYLQYVLKEVLRYDHTFNRKEMAKAPPMSIAEQAIGGFKILTKFFENNTSTPKLQVCTVY